MDTKDKVEASQLKLLARQRIKSLTGDSEWDLIQQIAQEIEAHYVIKKEKLSLDKHLEYIKQEVRSRYSDQPDMLELIEEAIPSRVSISQWKKKKGWEDAVWMKIRGEGLFTTDRRAQVIHKLFEQAAQQGNVQAAKIWLTLSGDYVEKDNTQKSETLDLFRELNEAIHNKK